MRTLGHYDIVLRCFAAFFALVSLVGLTWWRTEYTSVASALYAWSPVMALGAEAMSPTRVMAMPAGRLLLGLLALVAATRICWSAVDDLRLVDGGPDYPAFGMRVLMVSVLLIGLVARIVALKNGGPKAVTRQ
jgi:hypothetical protein